MLQRKTLRLWGIKYLLQVTQLRLIVKAICLTSTAACLEKQGTDTRVDLTRTEIRNQLVPWFMQSKPHAGESQRFWKLVLPRASQIWWSVCPQAEASVQYLLYLPTPLQKLSQAEAQVDALKLALS